VRFWKFATTEDGRPADTSRRHPLVRELARPRDARLLADYSRPEFVLAGWRPSIVR